MGERRLHYKLAIVFVQTLGKKIRTAKKKIHPLQFSRANWYTSVTWQINL